MGMKKKRTKKKTTHGGRRKGAGRKVGDKNTVPHTTSASIKAINTIFRRYGIPGTESNPVEWLKKRGIANPVDIFCLEKRLSMVMASRMPRNAVAKSAMLRDIETRAGAKDQFNLGEMGFIGLVLGMEKREKEEEGDGNS